MIYRFSSGNSSGSSGTGHFSIKDPNGNVLHNSNGSYYGGGQPEKHLAIEIDSSWDYIQLEGYCEPCNGQFLVSPVDVQLVLFNDVVGQTGPAGTQGPQGPAGPQGPTGNTGPVGAAGTDGNDGANGSNGSEGSSAYQIWLAAGNTGTESEFLASLVGADGQDGAQGPAGPAGSGYSHYVGEFFQGGIIFHLWKDPNTETEHGLILYPLDLPRAAYGYDGVNIEFPDKSNGQTNLQIAIEQGIEPGTVFEIASNFSYDGYDDWYLPAEHEARMIIGNILIIQNSVKSLGYPYLFVDRMWTSNNLNTTRGGTMDINFGNRGFYSTAASNFSYNERLGTNNFCLIRRF